MSASAGGGHQPSQSRAIPTRTVAISDAAQLPQDYCTTPGGTLFSTTPGGEPRPACPPSRLARGTACSANSFLSAARTAGCRPCTLRGGGLPLELSLRAFRGGGTGAEAEDDWVWLSLRVPRRGSHALCLPRPGLTSLTALFTWLGESSPVRAGGVLTPTSVK